MTKKRICFLSFVITLLIWTWFSWPLPRHVTTGIPASAHLEPAEVRPLIPGDHLQFMYYCWLAGDMIFGKTPLFCNLYEFNTGEAFAEPTDLSGVALAKTEAIRAKAEAKNTISPHGTPKGGGRKPQDFASSTVVKPLATKAGLAKEGDEKTGYRPNPYYFPFSLIYAVSALTGGRAFGWNSTGLISLWLTFFLTWLLVRRYTKETWLAGCAALITIIFPFRWINLCGGSPAGFAMMWIPAIFLGIDLAARDGKSAGGVLAGFSLLFASWTDNHIFFFGTLAAPFWTLIAISAGLNKDKKWQDSWQKIFAALLPMPLFLGGALAFPALMQMLAGKPSAGQYLASSVDARAWREIALYSPTADNFFAWFSSGLSSHIYIGVSVFVFLTAGILCLAAAAFRRQNDSRRRLLVMVLLLAGIAGVMALALGANGPVHAILLRICRKIIPPYAMIRQPAKIFCLLPSFLAVAAGISLSAIFVHFKNSKIKIFVALLFCAAVMGEYGLRVNPTVSILDNKQGAYEAVANDAASTGQAPHALVVPLWPGNAADSSIYQYYASLYRIRMINGYNPFVSKSYFENVFRPYESVNQGWLTDKQIDELLRRKIEYIILHEDLFPEKVSPFPVGWTLKQFLTHKRLQFVKQDGRVWAFKILAEPKKETKSEKNNWETFACARNWEAENLAAGKTQIIRDFLKTRGSYASLHASGSWLAVPAMLVAPAPQLRWMIRARGGGTILAEVSTDETPVTRDLIDIQSDDWEWIDIPVENFYHFAPLSLKIEYESGSVDCGQILLVNGKWLPPSVGQTIDLPAPCMFHAGYTSLSNETVVFEKEHEAQALIFYGPKLPLEKGRYRIELVFSSDSPKGVLLGQFNIKRHDRDYILNWIPVVAGARSLTEFTQLHNVPMHLEFRFLGNGNLKISGIRIMRLE